MDLEDIQNIIKAFEEANVSKLSVKKGGFEIALEKESSKEFIPVQTMHAHEQLPMKVGSHELPVSTHQLHAEKEAFHKQSKEGKYITSPMVGTFYSSPSPDEPPFVKVGDHVEEQTVVCIVEAMKVMNEVKAGMKGVIKEILIENGHPLEFGTKIFEIE